MFAVNVYDIQSCVFCDDKIFFRAYWTFKNQRGSLMVHMLEKRKKYFMLSGWLRF